MLENLISRRPFLKTAIGAGLASALVKGQEEAAPKAEGKKLGWALVGLSSLSESKIAPALLKTKHSRLTGIVTGTPEKAEAWSKKYGIKESGIYNYENFDEIINNPEVDVVYIVLPNSMHKEFTLRGAKAGKHVFCEKPMAVSPQESRDMIAACEAANVKLGMGYRLQFEPHHVEAIRFAREKVFGEVRHIDAGFGFKMRSADGWRLNKALGGGALLDVGVYAIQGARYIMGEEPVIVSALETKTDKEMFAEVDETIQIQMQFASGKTANLFTTFNLGGYNQLTAFAEKGRFGLNSAFGTQGQSGWTSDPKIPLSYPKTDHFEVQMDLFSQAIIEGKEWTVDGTEGLRDQLVMDAVFKSIATGAPVEVEKV
ncbi:MAG: Gfo/Idh/MocA family oxidoreductase [Luteolibacter sp.]